MHQCFECFCRLVVWHHSCKVDKREFDSHQRLAVQLNVRCDRRGLLLIGSNPVYFTQNGNICQMEKASDYQSETTPESHISLTFNGPIAQSG